MPSKILTFILVIFIRLHLEHELTFDLRGGIFLRLASSVCTVCLLLHGSNQQTGSGLFFGLANGFDFFVAMLLAKM